MSTTQIYDDIIIKTERSVSAVVGSIFAGLAGPNSVLSGFFRDEVKLKPRLVSFRDKIKSSDEHSRQPPGYCLDIHRLIA